MTMREWFLLVWFVGAVVICLLTLIIGGQKR